MGGWRGFRSSRPFPPALVLALPICRAAVARSVSQRWQCSARIQSKLLSSFAFLPPTADHHPALPAHPQVPAAEVDMASSCVACRFASFQQEYGLKEPALAITAAPAAAPPTACLIPAAGQQLVDLLLTLPHGVMKHSHAVQGERA